MPWSPQSFRERHNQKLGTAEATRASRIANAILAKSGDEGKAIRIANARARAVPMKPKTRLGRV